MFAVCTVVMMSITLVSAKEKKQATGEEDRQVWVNTLVKIADPVLSNLANNTGLSNAVNPSAPNYLDFSTPLQPLVDAAFLAQDYGTYPIVGRSIAYLVGVFQALVHMALIHRLPKSIQPAQK